MAGMMARLRRVFEIVAHDSVRLNDSFELGRKKNKMMSPFL